MALARCGCNLYALSNPQTGAVEQIKMDYCPCHTHAHQLRAFLRDLVRQEKLGGDDMEFAVRLLALAEGRTPPEPLQRQSTETSRQS